MKIHKKKPATKFLCYSAADRVFDTRNSAAGQLCKIPPRHWSNENFRPQVALFERAKTFFPCRQGNLQMPAGIDRDDRSGGMGQVSD